MTTYINARTTDLNRRDFLGAATGLTLALTVAPNLAFMAEASAEAPLSPNVWLTIATDGSRRRARCRLGQGEADLPTRVDGEKIRQSGIRQLRLPDLGELRGAR